MLIPDDWLPTTENVNSLPEPLKRYIHDLESRCDHTGDVRTIWCLRDQVKGLTAMVLELSES